MGHRVDTQWCMSPSAYTDGTGPEGQRWAVLRALLAASGSASGPVLGSEQSEGSAERDQPSLMAEQDGVIRFSEYWKQGRLAAKAEQHSVKDFATRMQFRHRSVVQTSLDRWWAAAPRVRKSFDEPLPGGEMEQWNSGPLIQMLERFIQRDTFMVMQHKVCKALLGGQKWAAEEVQRTLEADWTADANGGVMTKDRFCDAVFELCDLWSEQLGAKEYAAFLDELLSVLTVSVPRSAAEIAEQASVLDDDEPPYRFGGHGSPLPADSQHVTPLYLWKQDAEIISDIAIAEARKKRASANNKPPQPDSEARTRWRLLRQVHGALTSSMLNQALAHDATRHSTPPTSCADPSPNATAVPNASAEQASMSAACAAAPVGATPTSNAAAEDGTSTTVAAGNSSGRGRRRKEPSKSKEIKDLASGNSSLGGHRREEDPEVCWWAQLRLSTPRQGASPRKAFVPFPPASSQPLPPTASELRGNARSARSSHTAHGLLPSDTSQPRPPMLPALSPSPPIAPPVSPLNQGLERQPAGQGATADVSPAAPYWPAARPWPKATPPSECRTKQTAPPLRAKAVMGVPRGTSGLSSPWGGTWGAILSPRELQHRSRVSHAAYDGPSDAQRVRAAWRTRTSSDGRRFYHNVETDETAWELPPTHTPKPPSKALPQSEPWNSFFVMRRPIATREAIAHRQGAPDFWDAPWS